MPLLLKGGFGDHDTVEADNSKHSYFIQILKAVLDILEPIFASPDDAIETENPKPKARANSFEFLEIEYCVDDDLPVLSGSKISEPQTKPIRPNSQKEEANTERDWFFKAYCAFQDFNDIREHVKGVWKGYRDGEVDLVAASIVTEAAFHLMEDIERTTLCPTVDGKQMSPLEVALLFFEDCCEKRGQEPCMERPGPMWDLAKWLSLSIKPHIDQWIGGDVPQKDWLREMYGTYDPSADRSKMSEWQKYCEDCTILAHIILDIVVSGKLERFGQGIMILDKVTATLAELAIEDPNDPDPTLDSTQTSSKRFLMRPFSQNPVLCGCNVLTIYLHLQKEGMHAADHWWSIMPMAHVYGALKQNSYLSFSWSRMEKLIKIQTPEYLFFGGAPKDFRTCYTKLRLAEGLPADMNSRDARPRAIAQNRPEKNFASNMPPMTKLLRTNMLPRHEDNHIRRPNTNFHRPLNQLFNHLTPKTTSPGKEVGSLDLLNFVQDNLTKELEGIKFNYRVLNQECIEIACLLVEEFFKILPGYEGKENYPLSLIKIAEDILMFAETTAPYLERYCETPWSPSLQRAAKLWRFTSRGNEGSLLSTTNRRL
ncbi:hypothetical protein BDZ45DRAFT_726753 [Acephala macrosclerotiorum]|nr:hypothetical protein BDZ45DRAFT_726753 [Acephala macrosclerotiorum]